MFRLPAAQFHYPYLPAPRFHPGPATVGHSPTSTVGHIFQPLFVSFFLACVLFMLHGIEEFYGGFQTDDPVWQWLYRLTFPSLDQSAAFLTLHFLFWLGLIVAWLMMSRGRVPYLVMSGVAVVMFLEIYHLGLAIVQTRYIGGVVTSALLFLAGSWFGLELSRAWRQKLQPHQFTKRKAII